MLTINHIIFGFSLRPYLENNQEKDENKAEFPIYRR